MTHEQTFSSSSHDYLRTTVILFTLFLSKTFGSRRPLDTFRFEFAGKEPITRTFTSEERYKGFDQYQDATNIFLVSGDVLYTSRYSTDNVESLLHLTKATLHMCVEIQKIDLRYLAVNVVNIKGNCGGDWYS
ncbi:hypothetical protein GCK32_012426 [Trichostrongylus colubriformis]|uniref:Uncharacterized protein n=1 Tax=Trichostrongylus colubriformis TaxID=6319 RepID=A0AAN8ET02_TRICO